MSGSSLGNSGLVNGDNSSIGVSHEAIVGGGSRDGGDSGIPGVNSGSSHGGSGIGGVDSRGGHGGGNHGVSGVNTGGIDRGASSVVVISSSSGNRGLVNWNIESVLNTHNDNQCDNDEKIIARGEFSQAYRGQQRHWGEPPAGCSG